MRSKVWSLRANQLRASSTSIDKPIEGVQFGEVGEARLADQQTVARIGLISTPVISGTPNTRALSRIAPATDADDPGALPIGQEIGEIGHVILEEPGRLERAIDAERGGAGGAIDPERALLDRPVVALIPRRWAPHVADTGCRPPRLPHAENEFQLFEGDAFVEPLHRAFDEQRVEAAWADYVVRDRADKQQPGRSACGRCSSRMPRGAVPAGSRRCRGTGESMAASATPARRPKGRRWGRGRGSSDERERPGSRLQRRQGRRHRPDRSGTDCASAPGSPPRRKRRTARRGRVRARVQIRDRDEGSAARPAPASAGAANGERGGHRKRAGEVRQVVGQGVLGEALATQGTPIPPLR